MTAISQTRPIDALPAPLESETLALLRLFLAPIFERATDWDDLIAQLGARGFSLGFCTGRLVVIDDHGRAICTGRCLGVPLAELATRLGRPHIRADRTGRSGWLH